MKKRLVLVLVLLFVMGGVGMLFAGGKHEATSASGYPPEMEKGLKRQN